MTAKIVFYSATWCQQCPQAWAQMQAFAKKHPDVVLEKVVTDKPEPGQVVPNGLLGVPAVDLYQEGEYLGRLTREAARPVTVKSYLGL